jgi:hypothetical protein
VRKLVGVQDLNLRPSSRRGALTDRCLDHGRPFATFASNQRITNEWYESNANICWLERRKKLDFIGTSDEVTALITVWLEVRVLPGLPGISLYFLALRGSAPPGLQSEGARPRVRLRRASPQGGITVEIDLAELVFERHAKLKRFVETFFVEIIGF